MKNLFGLLYAAKGMVPSWEDSLLISQLDIIERNESAACSSDIGNTPAVTNLLACACMKPSWVSIKDVYRVSY